MVGRLECLSPYVPLPPDAARKGETVGTVVSATFLPLLTLRTPVNCVKQLYIFLRLFIYYHYYMYYKDKGVIYPCGHPVRMETAMGVGRKVVR